jgi:hypothetical protein
MTWLLEAGLALPLEGAFGGAGVLAQATEEKLE